MSDKNERDPWAEHYHIAFTTGRSVGFQAGYMVGTTLGAAFVFVVWWLAGS